MELYSLIAEYDERRKIAHNQLARKKMYLEKKINDPNTTQGYKDLLKDEIKDFESYIVNAENIIAEYRELIEEIGNQKFSQGYKRGCKDERDAALGGVPNKYFDKEQYREYSKLNLIKEMPQLF